MSSAGSCIIVYTARSSPSPTPSTSLPAAVNREISLKARLVCSTDFRYQPPAAAGNFAHLCSRNSLQLSHWKPPSSSSLATHFWFFPHSLARHGLCPRCMTARAARADVICVLVRAFLSPRVLMFMFEFLWVTCIWDIFDLFHKYIFLKIQFILCIHPPFMSAGLFLRHPQILVFLI